MSETGMGQQDMTATWWWWCTEHNLKSL